MLKSHQIALSLVAASTPLAESVGAQTGSYFLNLLVYLGWGVTIKKAKLTNLQQIQEGHVSSTPQLFILSRNLGALVLFSPVSFLSDGYYQLPETMRVYSVLCIQIQMELNTCHRPLGRAPYCCRV